MFGLVLGGGGARGLAHIGVLRVLEREGYTPGVYAGTSMGGLVAAFAAAGHPPSLLEEVAGSVPWRTLLDIRPGSGLLRASGFAQWTQRWLPATFEALACPLALTATDMLSGRQVYLSRGDLGLAIQATTAYPGAADPVAYRGMLLLDGGILNQVPVDAALFLGVTRVLAVDVTASTPLQRPGRTWRWQRENHVGTVRSLRRAVDIMQAQLTETRLSFYHPDLLLTPELGDIDLTSFRRVKDAVAAGERAAERALPQLHALFGNERRQ